MDFKSSGSGFKTGYLVHITRVDPETGSQHEESVAIEDLDDLCDHFCRLSLDSLRELMDSGAVKVWSMSIEEPHDIVAEVAAYRQFRPRIRM